MELGLERWKSLDRPSKTSLKGCYRQLEQAAICEGTSAFVSEDDNWTDIPVGQMDFECLPDEKFALRELKFVLLAWLLGAVLVGVDFYLILFTSRT